MKLARHLRSAFQTPEAIRFEQERRLREHVRHCLDRSPFYRAVLRAERIPWEAPLGELLAALPLTSKTDLETANDAFLAAPPEAVSDLVLSSGTTGHPTRIAYTEHDLRRLAYNEEKAFLGCGLTRRDVVLLTCTLDRCFIAGLAYFLGIRNIGATAIRNGHGTLNGHAELLRRVRPTALVGVPSFLRKLGSFLHERGVDAAALGVRRLVVIGEPVRDRGMALLRVGRDLEQLWGARVYSTYASSEIVTSFCECTAQNGGHLPPDLAVVEILDERDRPLPAGEVGEVVVTPLGVEGMPLLRFRTGDLSFLLDGPCACGRRAVRLGPILGRKAQMLKVQGTTLYPPAVFAALAEQEDVADYYVSAHSDERLSDRIVLHVALREGARLTAVELADRLAARLRVKPAVSLEPEADIRAVVYTPESRKPVRFVDRRGAI